MKDSKKTIAEKFMPYSSGRLNTLSRNGSPPLDQSIGLSSPIIYVIERCVKSLNLPKITTYISNVSIMFCYVMLFLSIVPSCLAEIDPNMASRIVDAIYIAEGGDRAAKPYGILSVPCGSKDECRKICENTVRNNYKRWQKAGNPGTYLEFLASRYAPVGVSNDPKGLNRNWLKNVQTFVYEVRK